MPDVPYPNRGLARCHSIVKEGAKNGGVFCVFLHTLNHLSIHGTSRNTRHANHTHTMNRAVHLPFPIGCYSRRTDSFHPCPWYRGTIPTVHIFQHRLSKNNKLERAKIMTSDTDSPLRISPIPSDSSLMSWMSRNKIKNTKFWTEIHASVMTVFNMIYIITVNIH
jgi:hypothetical protein